MAVDVIEDFSRSVLPQLMDSFPSCVLDRKRSSAKEIVLRMDMKKGEEAEAFKKLFARVSKTEWNVHNYSRGHRFSKKWICHHSRHHKRIPKRDAGCTCKLHITIKDVTKANLKTDPFLTTDPPLRGEIRIGMQHSHDTNSVYRLQMLRVADGVRESFFDYFSRGMSVPEAIRFHRNKCLQEGKAQYLASSAINPTNNQVHYMLACWRRNNPGLMITRGYDNSARSKRSRSSHVQSVPSSNMNLISERVSEDSLRSISSIGGSGSAEDSFILPDSNVGMLCNEHSSNTMDSFLNASNSTINPGIIVKEEIFEVDVTPAIPTLYSSSNATFTQSIPGRNNSSVPTSVYESAPETSFSHLNDLDAMKCVELALGATELPSHPNVPVNFHIDPEIIVKKETSGPEDIVNLPLQRNVSKCPMDSGIVVKEEMFEAEEASDCLETEVDHAICFLSQTPVVEDIPVSVTMAEVTLPPFRFSNHFQGVKSISSSSSKGPSAKIKTSYSTFYPRTSLRGSASETGNSSEKSVTLVETSLDDSTHVTGTFSPVSSNILGKSSTYSTPILRTAIPSFVSNSTASLTSFAASRPRGAVLNSSSSSSSVEVGSSLDTTSYVIKTSSSDSLNILKVGVACSENHIDSVSVIKLPVNKAAVKSSFSNSTNVAGESTNVAATQHTEVEAQSLHSIETASHPHKSELLAKRKELMVAYEKQIKMKTMNYFMKF